MTIRAVAETSVIGFIGLGLMGRPMALNLRRAGFTLVVHNRSRAGVDALVAAGASLADSPADLARAADILITMLPDTPDVEAVLAGGGGVLATARPGTVVVDMSTISPAATRTLAARAAEAGLEYLDAPVSGGEIGAVDGTLSIMVGGEARVLERVRPVLSAMGAPDRITHVGPAGAGQVAKACNQMVIAATLGGVAEAFALARRSGLDPGAVRRALLGGFAASRVLEVHGQRMLDGNYVPGFRAALFDKDLRLAAGALVEAGVPAPVTAAAAALVAALIAAGRGAADYSALATVVFDRAGIG